MKRQLLTTALWLMFGPLFVTGSLYAEAQTDTAAIRLEENDSGLGRKVVMLIENDQWETADALLAEQDITANETLQALQQILDEYRALEKARTDKQQELFDERYHVLSTTFERIAQNDPNLNYLRAFRQLQNVWKDASDAQKKDIAGQTAFDGLMDHARQNVQHHYANGHWSSAYTTGAWWLTVFEPESPDSLQWDKKLSEVNAILEFLRVSNCEDKKQRYESVQQHIIARVFSILEANYVKPLNYDKMASGMLNRGIVLGDVLKTSSEDLVIQIDPNTVPLWVEPLQQWSEETGQREKMNSRDLQELLEILLALNEKTLKVPAGLLLSMLTDAALAELDSYTNVVWPYAVKDFDKAMTGQFGGIGVHIRKERGGLRVLSLIPDTPAMQAGLQADALIVAVDGQSTADMSATCAVQKISGPVGTSVSLTIKYPGAESEELVTIVRDKIVVPAVEGSRQAKNNETEHTTDVDTNAVADEKQNTDVAGASDGNWEYFLDEDARIGYLRLKTFTEQSIPEVTAALNKMENGGLTGLILDLRGNGGGLLTAAVEIADLFVDDGILLHSRGRDSSFGIWTATDEDGKRTYPLAVLLDGASASASEIVAGILSCPTNNRAILVGQRSYGKGSVQEVVDMGEAYGKLKYTAAFYYLPDGSLVKNRDPQLSDGEDEWGINPKVNVTLYDFERQQIRQINARRTRVSNSEEEQSQAAIREEMLSADPQLTTALMVLKAKIAVGE